MKKHSHLSIRQRLCAAGFLLLFAGITFFLFSYQRDEKRFANIMAGLFEAEMKANTLNLHYTLASPEDFGIYDYSPTLGCYRAEDSRQSRVAAENTLAALNELHRDRLSETDSWLWLLMTRSLENTLALNDYPYYSDPLSPASGAQSQLPILLAEYTFRSKKDVEDYLALLDQTDEYFASLLAYQQEKAAAGLNMPGSFLKEVRKQCDTIVTSEALLSETHFLQTTFRERLEKLLNNGEITEEDAQNYTAQNNRLLNTVLLPAYANLGDGLLLLEDDSILPAGLASLPDGKAYYKELLIAKTGSYRSIEQIQELLSRQFSKEYDEVREIVSAHPELTADYKNDIFVNFPYKDTVPILADLQKRMSADFPPIPQGTTQAAVKPVSPSLEPYCAPAFYLSPPMDDTDANTIYINKQKTPQGLELYTTLAHEGYPGHLYQTVYFNRYAYPMGERPARELLGYGGYQEGWALYVEFLSYDYAAQLLREYGQDGAALAALVEKHNRSLQLCLYSLMDIMIHYEGASYNQIAKMLENFGITDSASVKSLYHYIVQEPCTYLKYYLGYLEILCLQEKAQELWKEGYTDLLFHSFYLNCGPSDFLTLEERLTETPLEDVQNKHK